MQKKFFFSKPPSSDLSTYPTKNCPSEPGLYNEKIIQIIHEKTTHNFIIITNRPLTEFYCYSI